MLETHNINHEQSINYKFHSPDSISFDVVELEKRVSKKCFVLFCFVFAWWRELNIISVIQ